MTAAFATGEDSLLLYQSIQGTKDFYDQLTVLATQVATRYVRRRRVVFMRAKPFIDAVAREVTAGVDIILFNQVISPWFDSHAEQASCVRAYVARLLASRARSFAMKLDLWTETTPLCKLSIVFTHEETDLLALLGFPDRKLWVFVTTAAALPHRIVVDKFIPGVLFETLHVRELAAEDPSIPELLQLDRWKIALG